MAKYKPKWVKTKDENHDEVVDALVKAGCSVYDASEFGDGFPDIVVGRAGSCYLLEIKSASGQLRKKQIEFQMSWRGHFAVVRSPMEALQAVGLTSG
jgi:Holliday junction resolvase